MEKTPRVVAMLFGRGGSAGLPGKNVATILNRPSMHYPLMAARASGIVDDIYVSTDSDEIFALARPFDVKEIQRPASLASNSALLEDAIFHAFEVIDAPLSGRSRVDYYLILLCNSVTVLPDRIRSAFEMLSSDPHVDSVTTVAKWNMFSPVRARRATPDKQLVNFVPLEVLKDIIPISCDRDKSEDCFFCDNSFTLVRRESLSQMHQNNGPFKWMGNRIGFVEQLPGAGDIDLSWQIPVVEWWLREHGFDETHVPYATQQGAAHRGSPRDAAGRAQTNPASAVSDQ
jgi:CMP-N-acetylneuraminic acid synthetase